jgi:hypothetical protein
MSNSFFFSKTLLIGFENDDEREGFYIIYPQKTGTTNHTQRDISVTSWTHARSPSRVTGGQREGGKKGEAERDKRKNLNNKRLDSPRPDSVPVGEELVVLRPTMAPPPSLPLPESDPKS